MGPVEFLGHSTNRLEWVIRSAEPFCHLQPDDQRRLLDQYDAALRAALEQGDPVLAEVKNAAERLDLPGVVRSVMDWYLTQKPALANDPWWNRLPELSADEACILGIHEWASIR